MQERQSNLMKPTIAIRQSCKLFSKFFDYEGLLDDYLEESGVVSSLRRENLKKAMFRKYIGKELPIFHILGSILMDDIILHACEPRINQIKKAFEYMTNQQILSDLEAVEKNFQQLVSIINEERDRFMPTLQVNDRMESLFSLIYSKIIEDPNFVNAVAQSSRILVLHHLMMDQKYSSPTLRTAIIEDSSITEFYPQILSIFVSLQPYNIEYIQIHNENGSNMEQKLFCHDSQLQYFSLCILEIKIRKGHESFICYDSYDLTLEAINSKKSLVVSSSNGILLKSCAKCQKSPQHQEFLKGERCKHGYCLECVISNYTQLSSMINYDCDCDVTKQNAETFLTQYLQRNPSSSLATQIQEKLKSPQSMKQSPSSSEVEVNKGNYKSCDLCNKNYRDSVVFRNSLCSHAFCLSCITDPSQHISLMSTCLSVSCNKSLDKKELEDFLNRNGSNQRILKTESSPSHYQKQGLLPNGVVNSPIKTAPCLKCSHQIEIPPKKDGVPQCKKCSHCNEIHCFDHNNSLMQCYCYCPFCFKKMRVDIRKNLKVCSCNRSFCLSCRKESTDRNPCECWCRICFEGTFKQGFPLCKNCKDNSKTCQYCFDNLLDASSAELGCGHKICLTCKNELWQKVGEMSCNMCVLLTQYFDKYPEIF